jgi:hypothetical protein
MNIYLQLIIIYIVLLFIFPPRYVWLLPTIPIYPNSEKEVLEVKKQIKSRTKDDIAFWKLTDPSISYAFINIVPESLETLNTMITHYSVAYVILFFKYSINRPRPKQINNKLNVLPSKTADTPAYPAGHAFQAYYLAKALGEKYPHLQNELNLIAEKCDQVRVKAGLHYPSDGEFAKKLVNIFF